MVKMESNSSPMNGVPLNNQVPSPPSFQQFLQFYHRRSRESSGVSEVNIALPSERDDRDEGLSTGDPDVELKPPKEEEVKILETEATSKEGGGGSEEGDLKLNVEITEIRKLLECPVCYEVIFPPINVCPRGHSTCNVCKSHLTNCPICRGEFTNVRNWFAEEFLSRCSLRCRYWEAGCRALLSGTAMAGHVQECEYRPLLCWQCDVEIPHHEYLEHLRVREKLKVINGGQCITGFAIPDFEREGDDDGVKDPGWDPVWIHALGQDFFCFLEHMDSHWWIWMGGFGTPEQYKNFIGSITVFNTEAKIDIKYTGPVNSLRASPKEVMEKGLCLYLSDAQISQLLYKGGIDLHIQVGEIVPPSAITPEREEQLCMTRRALTSN